MQILNGYWFQSRNRSARISGLLLICGSSAAVAQSVEQRIRNAKVTSSIPVSGTNFSDSQ